MRNFQFFRFGEYEIIWRKTAYIYIYIDLFQKSKLIYLLNMKLIICK